MFSDREVLEQLDQPTQAWDGMESLEPQSEFEVLPAMLCGDFTPHQRKRILDPELSEGGKLEVVLDVLELQGDFSDFAKETQQVDRDSYYAEGPDPDHALLDYVDGVSAPDRMLHAADDYLRLRADNEAHVALDEGKLFKSLTDDEKLILAAARMRVRHSMLADIAGRYLDADQKSGELLAELQPIISDPERYRRFRPEVIIDRINQPAPQRLAWLEEVKKGLEIERKVEQRRAEDRAAAQKAAEKAAAEQRARQAEAEAVFNIDEAAAELQDAQKLVDRVASQDDKLPDNPNPDDSTKLFTFEKGEKMYAVTVRAPRPKKVAEDIGTNAGRAAATVAVAAVAASTVPHSTLVPGGGSPDAAKNGVSSLISNPTKALEGAVPHIILPSSQPDSAVAQSSAAINIPVAEAVPVPGSTPPVPTPEAAPASANTAPAAPAEDHVSHPNQQLTHESRIEILAHVKNRVNNRVAVLSAAVGAQEPSFAEQPKTRATVERLDELLSFTLAHQAHGDITQQEIQDLGDELAAIGASVRHPQTAANQGASKLKPQGSFQKKLASLLREIIISHSNEYTDSEIKMLGAMWAGAIETSTPDAERQQLLSDYRHVAARLIGKSGKPHQSHPAAHPNHTAQPQHTAPTPHIYKAPAHKNKGNKLHSYESSKEEIVSRLVRAIAFQESSGRPTVATVPGVYGKYQYTNRTWEATARAYYPAALKYARADQAPEAVQDAVAYHEYMAKYDKYGGNLFDMAVSHFMPAAVGNPSLLDTVPKGNVHTPRQYAQKLIDSLHSGGPWEHIRLKYNQAPRARLPHAVHAGKAVVQRHVTHRRQQHPAQQSHPAKRRHATVRAASVPEPVPAPPAPTSDSGPVINNAISDVLDKIAKNTEHLGEPKLSKEETENRMGQKIVDVVEHEFNKHDERNLETRGQNIGNAIKEYTAGKQGQAWCAYFATWAAKKAGFEIKGGAADDDGRIANVDALAGWFDQHGKLFTQDNDEHHVQPGDFIMFGGAHVGIVTEVHGNNLVLIAGNASAGGNSNNGNTVGKRTLENYKDVPGLRFGRLPVEQ